ncbi:SurA N-terminal domain-containing protein [Desulfovibrio gilichinskyi]|uniref:Periplasmic chaperone for outer membrane proteins SurA n=1 Tax=Desulfovibrio gilichinskyi TaxID=1519643 RepID=A0A1X7CCJ9_9BACT|nr:SurA N-terminal domain-containing protein [Desulfovibrio gilichinskyi]SME94083.1 periplasmic chaperone for outer membrane proteins SurA [Desulfovibrio gilichinskyi]
MLKRVIIVFFIILISLFETTANAEEKVVDGIVAVVNGDIITLYEMNDKMAPIMKQFGKSISTADAQQIKNIRSQILDRMINEMIIDQEAKKLKVIVSEQDIDGEINRIKESSNLSDEDFLRQLALQKTNLEDFKETLRKDIRKHRLVSYKVKNKVVVTEKEIENVWNSTQTDQGSVKESVHLKLILFPDGVSADDIREEIISGKMTFEEAADKYTAGPGAGSGGDLGVLEWDDLAQTWHDALDGLKVGDISQVFKVQQSSALLKLDSFEKQTTKSFADSRDVIYERLYREKQDAVFNDFINKLREKAVIEIK